LRLGTHRISNPESLSHDRFNHHETDERIYHALVDGVLKSWDTYTLRDHEIVSKFRLAKSNYNDALFIHPPGKRIQCYSSLIWFLFLIFISSVVFVYLSALLNSSGMG
jgi:hypothetical protein